MVARSHPSWGQGGQHFWVHPEPTTRPMGHFLVLVASRGPCPRVALWLTSLAHCAGPCTRQLSPFAPRAP